MSLGKLHTDKAVHCASMHGCRARDFLHADMKICDGEAADPSISLVLAFRDHLQSTDGVHRHSEVGESATHPLSINNVV